MEQEQRRNNITELIDIGKKKLMVLSNQSTSGFFSNAQKKLALELEGCKWVILKLQEEEWGLKIHAIWIAGRDKNTKFFHNFSSKWRRENTT